MNDELMHYGVLGMKWGVRRYQNKDGSLTNAGKKHRRNPTKGWSKDAKAARSMKKKGVKGMSNAELKRVNERQRLENEYRNLNPGKISKGLKYAGVIAGGMGTMAALYNNSNTLIKIGKGFMKRGQEG